MAIGKQYEGEKEEELLYYFRKLEERKIFNNFAIGRALNATIRCHVRTVDQLRNLTRERAFETRGLKEKSWEIISEVQKMLPKE